MPRKSDSPTLKEALTNRDISDIRQDISNLSLTVEKGFSGIHLRQDTTNGKVLKAGEDIATLRSKFAYNRIIWYLFTAAISIIIALASYILFQSS
jgi:hypothetical protein